MAKICEHNWKMFMDKELIKTGWLSFYCQKCLALKKIKKEYE